MENKSKHPSTVIGYNGSLDQLVKEIGSMTYDQLSVFIGKLANDIKRQADGDSGRDRKQLAKNLYDAAISLEQAKDKINLAWKICEPYMSND